jgi:hypothetical protein
MLAFKKLIVFTLLINANSIFAQLTGTAFLVNQSNHSGIKVKFKANPGTAVTDSTLTDAAGNFAVNITGGSYNIEYSKTGYQTTYYASNTAQLLTNTVVLAGVTLPIANSVTLAGNVTGTLVNTNIYFVDANDITVPSGSTLIIQPGTQIRFNQYHPMKVYGTLIAEGTPGNKILFTSNKPTPTTNDWVGLELYSSALNSKITNCVLEYAYMCISVDGCAPLIEYNEIRNFWYQGIHLIASSGAVRYNLVHDFSGNGAGYGISYSDYNYSGRTPLIECNEIYNGNASTGIGAYATKGTVRNNLCHDIAGVGITASDSSFITNNIVRNCGNGIITAGPVLISNNTIYSCIYGIYLSNGVGRAIVNNIIVNNSNAGISRQGGGPIPTNITHNLVWNNVTNYDNVGMPGIGQPITTNANGDPIDAYYNFSLDPDFVGGVPPNLNPTSHAFGAGDATYSHNVGCDPNFICSTSVGIKMLADDKNFKFYPNPFADNVILKGLTDDVAFSFRDILGKDIRVNVVNISSDEWKVETTGLSPGIYFLTIKSGSASKTVKLIKN